MNEPSASNKKDDLGSSKFAIHKRTWFSLFFLVFVPWIVIAIPGTYLNSHVFAKANIIHYVQGWPFVHADRFEAHYFYFPKKRGRQSRQFIAEQVTENDAIGRPVLNLRFECTDFDDAGWYITDVWPVYRPSAYFRLRPVGIAVNLAFFLMCLGIGGYLIEFRLRRKGALFQYRMSTLLLGTTALAIATGSLTRSYRGEQEKIQHLERIQRSNPELEIGYSEETAFPLLLSQLFNHGKTVPFNGSAFFKRISTGAILVSIYDNNQLVSELTTETIQLLEDSPLPIHLEVLDYDKSAEDQLERFANIKVERIRIQFNDLTWLKSVDLPGGDSEKKERIESPKINWAAKFQYLKELNLWLDDRLDQPSQIRPFLDVESLEKVELFDVNLKGASFILNHLDDLPADTRVEFMEEVPREMIDKIESNFDSETAHPGLRSVVPVVG